MRVYILLSNKVEEQHRHCISHIEPQSPQSPAIMNAFQLSIESYPPHHNDFESVCPIPSFDNAIPLLLRRTLHRLIWKRCSYFFPHFMCTDSWPSPLDKRIWKEGCGYRTLTQNTGIEWGYIMWLKNMGIPYLPDWVTAASLPTDPGNALQLSTESYLPHHNDFEPVCPISCCGYAILLLLRNTLYLPHMKQWLILFPHFMYSDPLPLSLDKRIWEEDEGIGYWLKSLPLFKFSLCIPSLSLPGGLGDVPIVSDQNTVGWYIIWEHRLVDRRAHELPAPRLLPQLFNNASCV